MQNLREEVQVRDKSSLEDDRHVGGIEELNRVWLVVSSHSVGSYS
jgi:RNA-splicing ligase RtcB